jgi:hypothetical protein
LAKFRIIDDPLSLPFFEIDFVNGEPPAEQDAFFQQLKSFLKSAPRQAPPPPALAGSLERG